MYKQAMYEAQPWICFPIGGANGLLTRRLNSIEVGPFVTLRKGTRLTIGVDLGFGKEHRISLSTHEALEVKTK